MSTVDRRSLTRGAAPVVDPVLDPAVDPVVDAAADAVADPAVDPVGDPLVDPVADPVVERVVDPSDGSGRVAGQDADTAVAGDAEHPAATAVRWRQILSAYVALTKPRIIELLLLTTVPVMFLASDGVPGLWLVVATVLGGTLSAGSANALNCVVDADIDERMRRTRRRPLPRHAVTRRAALVFGLTLGVVSTLELGLLVNWLSAGLALSANVFYVVGYSMLLKRRTAQNIVWGGAAGCFPVLIGWTAVTGELAWAPVVLFAVVFFWTPPHFWALAIRYRDDYAAAGVPMLPVVAPALTVARQIVAYAWATVAASLLLWPVAGTGLFYPVAAGALGLALLVEAYGLLTRARHGAEAATNRAMRLFHGSNLYLALLFLAVAVDPFLR